MTQAAEERRVVESVVTDLQIGGERRGSKNGARFDVEDPATGEVIATVANGTADDAVAALDAAVACRGEWAATAPRVRGEILRKSYELLIERIDDLALLMTLEMGKPLADSRAEILYAAEFFRWFAEESVRIDGRYAIAPAGNSRLIVMHQPVGPCLLITPWNFPMAMATRKVGAAVAAGCTMILKPATLTPLSSYALAGVLEEAGLPPGVLNVVTTTKASDVSTPLLADPRLRKLSFTGSTEVGRALTELAAPNLQRVSMELGGNAPFVVFDDADLDAAVDGAVLAKMRNMGEACTAANRFLVHESLADTFAARLAERLGAMKVGRGTDDGVQVGPLVEAKAVAKVAELVDDAVERGATVHLGGKTVAGPGYFYAPTVLGAVPSDARLITEEIFGPVAPVVPFSTDDEAIAAANDTEYGLVAYAFTQDVGRALRVAEGLDTGMVGINQGIVSNPAAPFGGVKQSGMGREGGHEGIHEYLDVKYVGIAL
jgi:succinate-semialdehyde dehydrogenase/glutarate-semialdehyde dehydrogenase